MEQVRAAWKVYPPTQILLAARYGYKAPKEEKVLRAKDLVMMFRSLAAAKKGSVEIGTSKDG